MAATPKAASDTADMLVADEAAVGAEVGGAGGPVGASVGASVGDSVNADD